MGAPTRTAEPHARIPSFAGPSSVERLARCRQCGGDLPTTGARRTFCSGRCVSAWKIRTQPGYARSRVKERDRGVCASCGLDTIAAREMAIRVRRRLIAAKTGEHADLTLHRPDMFAHWPDAQIPGLPTSLALSWWAADHIVPVVEGGAEGGLENLRTLCRWCHGDETRALARRRAGYRDPGVRLNLLPAGLRA